MSYDQSHYSGSVHRRAGVNEHVAWSYKILEASNELPISDDVITAHLKIDLCSSAELQRIRMLVRSAAAVAEKYTRRFLITKTFVTYRDEFPCSGRGIELKKSPFQELLTFEYLVDGVYTAVDPTKYQVIEEDDYAWICPVQGESFPFAGCQKNLIKITFKAGIGDDDEAVCESHEDWVQIMLHGLLMHVTYLNENKGDCGGGCSTGGSPFGNLPSDVAGLYDQVKIISVAVRPHT